MAKALGGFLRFVFGLLILAVIGYNTWQITSLRAEVAAWKRERAGALPIDRADAPAEAAGLLAKARAHAERAQEFLRKKQYADAQREVAAAGAALEKASRTAEAARQNTLMGLRGALRSVSQQVESLWAREGGKEGEKKP